MVGAGYEQRVRRLEIRNSENKKLVLMCLSYLLENFFWSFEDPGFFLLFKNFFKKNRFFGQFFVILQVVWNLVLAKPYEVLEG
jgi:hypothetical protein